MIPTKKGLIFGAKEEKPLVDLRRGSEILELRVEPEKFARATLVNKAGEIECWSVMETPDGKAWKPAMLSSVWRSASKPPPERVEAVLGLIAMRSAKTRKIFSVEPDLVYWSAGSKAWCDSHTDGVVEVVGWQPLPDAPSPIACNRLLAKAAGK